MDLVRYEPFFDKYLFSYQGDLYVVGGSVEQEDGTVITAPSCNPENGLSMPVKVQIQITNRCNAKCPHCYVSSGRAVTSELSDSEVCVLLQECQKTGILQIEWSGGDPFMRKGFINLLKYAHSLGFEQDILTNGIILGRNPDLIREVWRYLYAVQVSIDAYGENFNAWVGNDAWDSVCEGVTKLVSEKPEYGQVSVATTLDRRNLADLDHIGTLLSTLGVDTWILARQVLNGRSSITEEEADELMHISYATLQEMRKHGVQLPPRVLHPFDKGDVDEGIDLLPVEWITEPAARTFLYVSSNGDVYPFPYYDGNVEWLSGNVKKSGLVSLWQSEPFARMRSVTRERTGCSGCKKICQLWSRWFNYGRRRDICETPISHPTCTYRHI